MADEPMPRNQEAHPAYNREPGIVPVPGSAHLQELAKFEQFHTKWTMGTNGPGNPYTYRPFPKMLYKAFRPPQGGRWVCMAAPPDPHADWRSRDHYRHAIEGAAAFNERCQRVVKNEEEMARAMEDGWRHTPQEAVEWRLEKDKVIARATAEREYEDRNMSDAAKAEMTAQKEAHGNEHQPEKIAEPTPGPRETIRFCAGKTKSGKPCGVKLVGEKRFCKRHEE